jgi:hypothetical protein
MRRHILLSLLLVLAGGAAGGMITSRLYWGYWLTPPDSGRTISELTSVERFSAFVWDGSDTSGKDVLLDAAKAENWISGETPMGRVAAALVRRDLVPVTSEPVPPNLLAAVRRDVEERGWFPDAHPPYIYARQTVGYLAMGRDASGQPMLIAALHGGQASNDHYPYYEMSYAVLPNGELQRRTGRMYWNDYAGLEGIAHWLGVFGGLCVGLAAGAILVVRAARIRRCSRQAA